MKRSPGTTMRFHPIPIWIGLKTVFGWLVGVFSGGKASIVAAKSGAGKRRKCF